MLKGWLILAVPNALWDVGASKNNSLFYAKSQKKQGSKNGPPTLEGDHLGVVLHIVVINLFYGGLAHFIAQFTGFYKQVRFEFVC